MAKEEKKTVKTKRPTPLKRDLQDEKKRLNNKMFKAEVKTAVKNLESALAASEKVKVSENLSHIYSLMDKGVKTGVYKQNKANRTKSRLTVKCT